MKKIFLLIILVFTAPVVGLNCQSNITIESNSEKFYKGNSMVNMTILGTDDQHITALVNKYSSGYLPGYYYNIDIAIFDKSTFNLVETKAPFTKDYINKGSFATEVKVLKMSGKIYLVFLHNADKKSTIESNGIYLQEIDLNGNLIGAPNQIISDKVNSFSLFYILDQPHISTMYYDKETSGENIYSIGEDGVVTQLNTSDVNEILTENFEKIKDNFIIYPKENEIYHGYYTKDSKEANGTIIVEYIYQIYSTESMYFSSYLFDAISVSLKDGWHITLPRKGILIKYFMVGRPVLIEKNGMLYLFYNDHTENFENESVDNNKNLLLNGYSNDLICIAINPKNGEHQKIRINTHNITRNRYYLGEMIELEDGGYAILGLKNTYTNYTFYKLLIN